MSPASAGHGLFDAPFLMLQGIGMAFFIFAFASPRRFSQGMVRWAAILVVVLLPGLWIWAFPGRGGIEGAARMMLAVPLVAMNAMFGFAAYLRTRRR
ncbi:MAG: hypothetical protein JNK48_26525 [Bryobacterales bacterium]|nr:hypothetical protein [Bryobacterales bacterium]